MSNLTTPGGALSRRTRFFGDLAFMSLRNELGAVVRLATPVALTQLGIMLMGTVDTMMLGRFSQEALAAGGLGHAIYIGALIFPMGVLMVLDPLISQAWGAGEKGRIARHLQRGLVLASLLAVPVGILLWNARPILERLGQSPEIAAGTTAYLRAVVPSVPAVLISITLRQTLQAVSLVRPALLAIIVANILNVFANYTLVFGHFGAPALGVVGAGCATSISQWTMALGVLVFAWPILRPYLRSVGSELWRLRGYVQMLKIGLPIGAHISLELWFFTGLAVLMGSLGAREMAAHQIAINLASLSFMVPFGIGAAAAARVGNAVGRQDSVAARRSAAVCLALGGSVMFLSGMLFWSVPALLSRAYTPDTEVIAVAATLLPIAAFFQIFDGLQAVSAGILRGIADTRVPAALALVCFWGIGLPLSAWLTFRAGFGPSGLWWGATAALGSVAILLMARLRWRMTGVIEAVHDE